MPPPTALRIDVDNPWFRRQQITLSAGQQLNISVGVSTFLIIREATVVAEGEILLGIDNQEADTASYNGFRYSTPEITYADGSKGPSFFERVSIKNTHATATSVVTFFYGIGEIDDLAATVSGTVATEEKPATSDVSSVTRLTASLDVQPPAGTLYTIITNLGGTGMLANGGTAAANQNIWISTEGTRPAPTAHNQLPSGDNHAAILIAPNYGQAVVNGTQLIEFDNTGSTDRIALIQFVIRS